METCPCMTGGKLFFRKSQSVKSLLRLIQWSRVTHICVGDLTIFGSDNGLSPARRQAITWTNAGILLIGQLGTNFSEILIEFLTFSSKKLRLKMPSAKWQPFCLGLNVLTTKTQHGDVWTYVWPSRCSNNNKDSRQQMPWCHVALRHKGPQCVHELNIETIPFYHNVIIKANYRFVPSQWETVLLCNDVSRWLGASLESAIWSIGTHIMNLTRFGEVQRVGQKNWVRNKMADIS